MTQEAGTITSDEGSAAGQAAGEQGAQGPVSLVDAQGNFMENWKDSLPEELRGEKCLDTFDDLPSAMKMLVNSQKLIGKKGLIVPGEKATAEERDAFYKALGRPDGADGYKIEVPEGMEKYYDKTYIDKFTTRAHAEGMTQKQLAGMMAEYDGMIRAGIARGGAEQEVARHDAEMTLREQYGDVAFEQRLHLANLMVEQNTNEKTKDPLLEAVGNNPVVIDFLATIAAKFMEAGSINDDAEGVGGRGMEDAIKQLRNTPDFTNGKLQRTNPAEFARIQKELEVLYNRAYPEKGSR